MNNNNENKLVPRLRFPEFQNAGEWEFKVFSEFIKLYRGSSPRPIQNYLTKNESGVNWIKIGDTKNADGFIIKQVEEKITPEGAEKSRKVNVGELILANSMSFGKTYQLAIEGFIYDGWFVLREYEEYFDRQFLLQLLNSDYMQNQYQKFSAGGIVQNISSDIVYSTILSYTSLPEQQKIASCLSSLDEVITGEQQKLELLKQHKKGLLQNLFPQEGETVPKLRFKEFENSGEWEVKKIGDILNVESSSLALNKLELKKNGYAVYGADSIVGYVDTYQHSEQYISIVKDGSGVGRLNLCKPKTSILGTLSALKSKDENKYQIVWAYYLLNTIDFSSYVKGAGIPHIYFSDYKHHRIGVATPKEQQKIAACLSSLDEIITAQTQKIEQLQRHKKGLLQGLFPFVSDTVETGHALSLPKKPPQKNDV